MGLNKGVIEKQVTQTHGILNVIKEHIEFFFSNGLHIADLAASGLATDFKKLHENIETAISKLEADLQKVIPGAKIIVNPQNGQVSVLDAAKYGPPAVATLDPPVADAPTDDEVKVDIPPAVPS